MSRLPSLLAALALGLAGQVSAQTVVSTIPGLNTQPPLLSTQGLAPPTFDAALAQRLGADARGMRRYVLVVLKTGPQRVPEGAERNAMFQGHFANMKRLSDAGLLKVAGPSDGSAGWRGILLFAVTSIDEARALVATDPVVARGEMVAEYFPLYLSAALMESPALHERLVPPPKNP